MENNIFGKRLRMLRQERELTAEELGKLIDKGRSTVTHYETNRRSPDIDDLMKIAKFFEVSVSYLIGETNERDTAVFHTDVNGHDLAITYRPGDIDHEFNYNDAMKVVAKLKSIGINVEDLLK